MLYAVPIGLVAGLLLGGRPAGLAELRFRWGLVFVLGLVVQLVLFSPPVTERIGALGPPIYVASTLMVLAALAGNVRVTGVPIVLAGAASNLAAIVANGGYMPAGAAALAALDRSLGSEYSNSAVVARPALEPLTDIFALPAWVPFTNVFSVGDVLIGVGVCVVVVAAMRRGRAGAAAHLPETGQPA
jgi:lipoprotein signal peptidase